MFKRHLVAMAAGVLLAGTATSITAVAAQQRVAAAPAQRTVHIAHLQPVKGAEPLGFGIRDFSELTASLLDAAKPLPPPPQDWIKSDDGSVDTGVGVYGDCSGRSELTHASAAIDVCLGGRTYFIGHNPGVFTGLTHLGAGDMLTYWDGGGNAHRIRIVATRQWYRFNGSPPLATADVRYQFQTCITLDGSWDEILDGVEA
jgi:hypothetical protein